MIYCPECRAKLEGTWEAIQGLHAEITRLRSDRKNMLVWIVALIKLQGGIVKVPVDLLVSPESGLKIERWRDSSRACEVLRVVEGE